MQLVSVLCPIPEVIRVFIPFALRYPCVSAPFIISKPQFLDADESLVKNVDGLKPDRDEHDIFLHLEMVCEQY